MQSVQRRTLIPQYHPEKDVKIANVRENGKQRKFKKAEVLKMRKKFLADEVESKIGGRVPFDLQFFADGDDGGADGGDDAGSDDGAGGGDDGSNNDVPPEPTTEERLQEALVAIEKLKRSQDKATSEAADWKKKYNATLTDTQKASQEKAEAEAKRQEEYDKLLRENTINKLANSFLKLKYTPEAAEKAATARYDGDIEAEQKLQEENQARLLKEKEAEWLKSRPAPKSGADGGDDKADPFLAGFNSTD